MINVLSLFDGMSCGRIALDRIGQPVGMYARSEIDKHASIVARANYPLSYDVGDVTKWREWPLDWGKIDLVMGGSPCQGFSAAGKQGGTKAKLHGQEMIVDTREKYLMAKQAGAEFLSQSHLFWEFVLIVDHVRQYNPAVKILLENVVMSRPNLDMITKALDVGEPVLINSNQYGPCDRPRYYWINWPFKRKTSKNFDDFLGRCVDFVKMPEGWVRWWADNAEFQLRKKYSKLLKPGDKGITMTARQYASWNGNFVQRDGDFFKPGKKSLALLVGAPVDYFKNTTQRQAELLTGNGWTVDVIAHILKEGGFGK